MTGNFFRAKAEKSCYNRKNVQNKQKYLEVFMGILIKGGRVIDPDTKLDEVTDVYIEDGQIQKVA